MAETYAAYIRISRLIDGSHSTAAEQRDKITGWMQQQRPAAVLRWYEDIDHSGRSEARPAWQRLLADLAGGGLAGVVVYNYTKTHRNVRDFLAFYDDHLAPRGQALIDVSSPYLNLASADGRMQATIFAAVAEHHANKTSELMTDTLRHIRWRDGRHLGRPPFGCDRDPATLHLVPSAALYLLDADGEAVAWREPSPPSHQPRRYWRSLEALYQLYSGPEVLSYTQAAHRANQDGWRAWQTNRSDPTPWTERNARRVLQQHHLYASGPQPDGWTAQHAPILDPALCAAVAARVAARAGSRAPQPATNHVYLLTGLAWCAVCGSRMSGQHQTSHYNGRQYRYFYYKHTPPHPTCPQGALAGEPIEAEAMAAINQLTERLAPATLAGLLAPLLQPDNQPAAPPRLAQARAETERLIDLHVKGLITQAQYISRHDALAAEIEQMEAGPPTAGIGLAGSLAQLLTPATTPAAWRDLARLCIQRAALRDSRIDAIAWRPWVRQVFFQ
jgi:DNA invertase Pin-like site-specific DNA recombinase